MRPQNWLRTTILAAITCSVNVSPIATSAETLTPSTSAENASTEANLPTSMNDEEKKSLFKSFIDLSFTGKTKDAYAMMDENMQSVFTKEKMEFVVKQLQTMFGDYKSVENITIEKSQKSGADHLKAWCIFANKSGDATAVINAQGKLTSLYVKPHADFANPPYAKHDQFEEQEVEIPSGNLKLKATLSVPISGAPYSCLVLVHGSGPCDRDETVGSIKIFRDLAWGLASNGIAVLRYEKRTRQYPKEIIKTVDDETVNDAVAAVEFLKAKTDIDSKRIFLLGHSLGALMVPRIAQKESSLAGVIICSGPTRKLEDIIVDQATYIQSLGGDGKGSAEALKKITDEAASVKALSKDNAPTDPKLLLGAPPSYWRDLRDYDAITTAQKLSLPILVMQGERDYQVTLDDLKGWQKGLDGHPNVTFKTYPGLSHAYTTASEKPGPVDYEKPQAVSQAVIDDVCQWLKPLPAATP